MNHTIHLSRRRFLQSTAPVAAISVLPRHVLGGPKYVSPNDKITIGYVGSGTQGIRHLIKHLPHPEVQMVAVCDPNAESTDYISWSRNELRNKLRKFLDQPKWDQGVKGCRCGRKVGKEIIEAYYAKNKPSNAYKGCKAYIDYREMMDNENGLDAVYCMTPDHHHGVVSLLAMNHGLHVITHKPIANVLSEIHLSADKAELTKLGTHLFCSADNDSTPTICEWIWNGAIGKVREVHNWSTRPFWPQGMTELPKERFSIPKGLDWEMWQGPEKSRAYHPSYTHAVFRGWYDFGTGALGDMGHYSFFQIFKILKLGSPTRVEASRSQYWAIINNEWKKQENQISFPRASMIHWEFPAREDMPPVSLHWYDGGLQPPLPQELQEDGEKMPNEGLLFVGDEGKILADFSGGNPRLIPKAKMNAFEQPPKTLPRPKDEFQQWVDACKGRKPSSASFDNALYFSETIALGNIALRVPQKLEWDGKQRLFQNSEEANQLMYRKYRKDWEI